MASSIVFAWASEQLEASSRLDTLEARGTVRIALRSAGLDAKLVSSEQMKVLLERVLPGELESRGIENAASLCAGMASRLLDQGFDGSAPESETPESIFSRLA